MRFTPMKKEWVLSIQRQCKDEGVPFFFKQWGKLGSPGKICKGRRMHTWPDDSLSFWMPKKDAGRLLNGRYCNASPKLRIAEFPGRKTKRERIERLQESFEQLSIRETRPLRDVVQIEV